jgi:hypothetical protein
MNLFFQLPVTPAYQQRRATMVDWMVEATGCTKANASQVLNDIENHSGSTTGGGSGVTALRIQKGTHGTSYPVFHHSAGKLGTKESCTGFWIADSTGLAKMVALGSHKGSDNYSISWIAQPVGYAFIGSKRPVRGQTINPF